MGKASTFVGLDVHKDSIDVTIAEQGVGGEVRHFGTIGGDLEAVAKLIRRLRRKGRELRFVYEAGPYGFEIYRFLREQGLSCGVVSPSQIPRRAGDRVKTDRRDSESLARLDRAGELAAVYVPEPEDESRPRSSNRSPAGALLQSSTRCRRCAASTRSRRSS